MTIQSVGQTSQTTDESDDWLALDYAPRTPIVAWCESHPGLSLLGANLLLWGAVACGFHFG